MHRLTWSQWSFRIRATAALCAVVRLSEKCVSLNVCVCETEREGVFLSVCCLVMEQNMIEQWLNGVRASCWSMELVLE